MPRVPFEYERRRPYLAAPFPESEYGARVDRVAGEMQRAGLDALIVYANVASYASVAYLSGLTPVHGNAFIVLHADRRMSAVMDGMLHCEPMHSMAWTCRLPDLRVCLGPLYGDPPEKAAMIAADAARGARRVGIAGYAALPALLLKAILAVHESAVPADAVIGAVRLLKSPAEIELMRRAGLISDKAWEAVFAVIGEGVEDFAVAAAAVGAMRALGATEAFETCVVTGKYAGLKHGYPRGARLAKGDMVFLDLGAHYKGYCSDMSRCTYIGGPVEGEARDLLELGLELYHAGLEVMGPGVPVKHICDVLEARALKHRLGQHFCPEGFGHGVGLDLFEGPGGLFNGSKAVLAPGMTIAYEPMVVVENLGTGVVEDTLLITDKGYELLNQYRIKTWN